VSHDACSEDGRGEVGASAPSTRHRTESEVDAAAPVGGWLTEEQQDAWKAVFGLASLLPGPLDAQLQRDSGLSLFEYSVLSSLSMQPSRSARMSSLARLSSGSLTRLSNVVRKLEGQGLVRRSPDPTDGRFTVAQLTRDGWDVVVAAAPGHVDAVRTHVLAPLPREHLAALVDVAERLGVMPQQVDDC